MMLKEKGPDIPQSHREGLDNKRYVLKQAVRKESL